jgi:hypothetical protein
MNPKTLERYKQLIHDYWTAIKKIGWELEVPALVREMDKLWPGLNVTGAKEAYDYQCRLYAETIQ